MNELLMLNSAAVIAANIHARAIISFIPRVKFESEIPVIWVQEIHNDILKDLTMGDILDVGEQHLLDAAVQTYLLGKFEEGLVVGVFPYAIIIYDLKEGRNFVNVRDFEDIVPAEVMFSILNLAIEIACEGREGRSVGTAFIVGDTEAILAHSHQAIINPYYGQRPEDCLITNRDNWESVKELAQLDGVFVIDPEGSIVTAGRYLDILSATICLPGGLGGRHRAAAAITSVAQAVGVTVSESGGVIRIFRDGECKVAIRSDIRIHRQSL
jgi:diadenylate cyclase